MGTDSKIERIAVDKIKINAGVQVRSGLSADHIDDLVEAIRGGAPVPPLDVFYDGQTYILAEGFHRYSAHAMNGATEIECAVHRGTIDDAKLFACGANKHTGLKLDRGSKRHAVELTIALKGDSWSDGKIAAHVGCHQTYVTRVRTESGQDKSSPDAKKLAADGKRYDTTKITESNHKRQAELATRKAAQAARDRILQLFGVDPSTIDQGWRDTPYDQIGLTPALTKAIKAARFKTAGQLFDTYAADPHNERGEGLQAYDGIGSADAAKVKAALITLFAEYAQAEEAMTEHASTDEQGTDAEVAEAGDGEGLEPSPIAKDTAIGATAPAVSDPIEAYNAAVDEIQTLYRQIAQAFRDRLEYVKGDGKGEHSFGNPVANRLASYTDTIGYALEGASILSRIKAVRDETKPGGYVSARSATQDRRA